MVLANERQLISIGFRAEVVAGIKTAKITSKTGKIVGARLINNKDLERDMIIISEKGQVIRLPLKSINRTGRATQGVRVMRFKEPKDKVASITLI